MDPNRTKYPSARIEGGASAGDAELRSRVVQLTQELAKERQQNLRQRRVRLLLFVLSYVFISLICCMALTILIIFIFVTRLPCINMREEYLYNAAFVILLQYHDQRKNFKEF